MGNYVIEVGNYVIVSPSQLGNYMSADTSAGFPRRLLSGDSAALASLIATVERLQSRADGARPSLGVVDQPYSAMLQASLVSGDRQGIVVHGRAGSGKSAIASEAVTQLAASGWYAAAVSMDRLNPGTRSARALGQDNDLAESPVILLDCVADGSPAVLLVDQMDAVSQYSGRLPDAYEAVAELLEQARLAPGLRIVLVVRTVDVQEDPRLRALLSDTSRVSSLTVGELDTEAVRRVLLAGGVDVDHTG